MALIKCKECSQEISDQANKCPQCGSSVKKPMSKLKLIFFIFVGFIVFRVAFTLTSAKEEAAAATGGSTSAAAPAPAQKVKGWEYETSMDKVSGKESKEASVQSNNKHELEFPYQGGTWGNLTLRKHPRYGKDVIFNVNKGQINCSVVDGCNVSVKIDDKPPYKVHAVEPEDHSTEVIFLRGYDRLVKDFKQSKHVIVEVGFFHNGSRVFEFNTADLKWD